MIMIIIIITMMIMMMMMMLIIMRITVSIITKFKFDTKKIISSKKILYLNHTREDLLENPV